MKFTVSMKDPDTLGDAISDAVRDDINKIAGLSKTDREAIFDNRREAVSELTSQWFEYGEYLRVEIDTEAKTITVLPVR